MPQRIERLKRARGSVTKCSAMSSKPLRVRYPMMDSLST